MSQRKPLILFVLSIFLIVMSSWTRWYFSGSLRADKNYIENNDVAIFFYMVFYMSGFLLLTYTYYQVIFRKENFNLSHDETQRLAYIGSVVAFFMTILFSSDIYTYLAEGELATRGIFTYTDGSQMAQSTFIDYVSHWWQNCPNHYGPPLLFIFFISVFLGKTVFFSYVVFKFLLLVVALLFVKTIGAVLKQQNTPTQYNLFALVVLSPLFFIEGAGQVHVDLVISLLLALFVYFFLQNKIMASVVIMSVTIACKLMYGMVLLPLLLALFFVKYINIEKNIKAFLLTSFASIFLLLVVVGLVYIPVWNGWETITTPIKFHETKIAARSFSELFILINKFGGELISNGFNIQQVLAKAADASFFPLSEVLEKQAKFVPIFKLLGLLLGAWNILPLIRATNIHQVFHAFARLWIIVITVYSPIFNPWYFLPVLVFLMFTDKKTWMLYAVIVISQSINGQLGTSTITPDSIWMVFASVQVIVLVPLFLLFFSKHLITEPYKELTQNNNP